MEKKISKKSLVIPMSKERMMNWVNVIEKVSTVTIVNPLAQQRAKDALNVANEIREFADFFYGDLGE